MKYPTSQDLSPGEFERMQLEAHMVFCRRCGLTKDQAVPMEQSGLAEVSLADGTAPYHIYRCPECNHTALSRAYPEEWV